jgi:hypothetical protein
MDDVDAERIRRVRGMKRAEITVDGGLGDLAEFETI